MKNAMIAAVLALGFVFSSAPAYAAPVGCDIPPDHAIYDDANTNIVGCIKAAVWEAAKAEGALDKAGLPMVARGATVTDEHGISDTCPIWYLWNGCVNIFGTEAYRSAMRATAIELLSKGYTATSFPSFKGWMDSVR